MKILFAGTPSIAIPSLRKLYDKFEITGVLTNPDKSKGRGKNISSCEVKIEAERLGLRIFQPEKLDSDFINEIKNLKPDILVVVAYGKIFKKEFLDIFPLGGLNVHPSLLPKYRGSSPIPSALLSGEPVSGISIQRIANKMDSGAILIQEEYKYQTKDTTESLTEYFSERGAELLAIAIESIINNTYTETIQNEEEATYCSYIKKDDGLIDWSKPAAYIERQLRAFKPWPGIYTYLNGKKLDIKEAKVFSKVFHTTNDKTKAGKIIGIDKDEGILVQTGEGILSIQRLQLQSKKALDWKAFINGMQNLTDTVLGGE